MNSMIQRLEPRRLLAATFEDGLLRVDGTKGNDDILVWEYQTGEKIAVRFGSRGKVITFNMHVIEKVIVESGRGDDRVELNYTGIATSVYGGRGDDTLWGANGPELLDGGNDDDVITSQGGDDTLIGGRGDDELYGGIGADLMPCGAGIDTVLSDGEHDRITDAEEIRSLDRWEEIEAKAGNITRVKFLQNQESVNAVLDFKFSTTGYGVTRLTASIDGTQIEITVGIAKWIGLSGQAITYDQRRVPLGNLPAGQYTVAIVSRGGELLKQATLTRA